MDSYLVAEGPSGLVIVDQHAAHERIVYNRLVATAAARQRQPLLVPILLHLTPVQAACLEDCRDDLALAGLEIDDFGSNVARLVAYDPVLPERRLDRLALEVIDTLVGEGAEIDLHKRLERAMYTVACHASVRFGQRLAREEMEELLRDLEVADPGITCPHGRPTLLDISESRLRREFKRSAT
jgi:DNA mismatch repair protein MutL